MTTHRQIALDSDLRTRPTIRRAMASSLGGPGSATRRTSGGLLAMLATGALWGTVFIGPELVAGTPATAVVGGRYVLFGLAAGVLGRRHLRAAPWGRATQFALTGFVGCYLLVVLAVQRAGAAPITVLVGTTPVVYAIVGARRAGFDARRLAGPLAVLLTGIVLVNVVDIRQTTGRSTGDLVAGLALGLGAVAMWTWYGLHNATWLRTSNWSSSAWTAVVGAATGVLALPVLLHGLVIADASVTPRLVGVWVVLGLGPAWLGTITWNVASRLLPETITGPLLVIETMFALGYAHVLHGTFPTPLTMLGYVLLMVGVVGAYATVTLAGPRVRAAAT